MRLQCEFLSGSHAELIYAKRSTAGYEFCRICRVFSSTHPGHCGTPAGHSLPVILTSGGSAKKSFALRSAMLAHFVALLLVESRRGYHFCLLKNRIYIGKRGSFNREMLVTLNIYDILTHA